MMDLKEFQGVFQPVLNKCLRAKQKETNALTDLHLRSFVSYPEQLLKRGKRIRPYLAAVMAQLRPSELKTARYTHPLVALELFHLFGLIHDDVFDRGKTRHGVPTIHEKILRTYHKAKRDGDVPRHAESLAILMGDYVYTWVFELLTDPVIPTEVQRRLRQEFLQMARDVLFGQMIDIDLTTRPNTTTETINTKMELKTASYTFIRPMRFGVALRGNHPDHCHFCDRFGKEIGIAFQIQDDYLDIIAPPTKTGKPQLNDVQERQHTYFTQFIQDHGTTKQKQQLHRHFGTCLTTTQRKELKTLFQESGAIYHGTTEIIKHLARAETILNKSSQSKAIKTQLTALIDLLRERMV
ncbi:hypothetical protein GF380_00210 [Candidatus Uhrbacteria bacterium]|nr:hypothetical protein [Candidatus Uhrbacteria bacterium]MBD3283843.1 hypothetical protein [Candidatus Uhrbacteria bacterium]